MYKHPVAKIFATLQDQIETVVSVAMRIEHTAAVRAGCSDEEIQKRVGDAAFDTAQVIAKDSIFGVLNFETLTMRFEG